ncbi:hypothetical protein [Pseudoduganella sp. GCM10020061]|uniref:hypothetical protein n=1 Tax=Pseudoduganella sp. GCM10020061 TaxID=3317345 RepID=UPI0036338B2D
MHDAASTLIDPELASFMESGISLNLASCDSALKPSVARAAGCRVTDGGRVVRVLVSQQQCARVLEHIAGNGRVAVVISRPSTHRTVQIKSDSARIESACAEDLAAVRRYLDSFPAELQQLGYDPAMIRTFLQCPEEDVRAVVFTPCAAFLQTPGSSAGRELKGAP